MKNGLSFDISRVQYPVSKPSVEGRSHRRQDVTYSKTNMGARITRRTKIVYEALTDTFTHAEAQTVIEQLLNSGAVTMLPFCKSVHSLTSYYIKRLITRQLIKVNYASTTITQSEMVAASSLGATQGENSGTSEFDGIGEDNSTEN